MEQIMIKKEELRALSSEDKIYINDLIKEVEEEMKNFLDKDRKKKEGEDIENAKQERIKRLEESISQLNPNKPEYPEELSALENKKLQLLENPKTEQANGWLENSTTTAPMIDEQLSQEQVAQNLVKKSSFKNTLSPSYPNPKKEESKQHRKINQILSQKKQGVIEQHLYTTSLSSQKTYLGVQPPSEQSEQEDNLIDKSILKPRDEKLSSHLEAQLLSGENEEEQSLFSNEQLQNATSMRNKLREYLSANSPTEWYQKPIEKRNAVDNYINQTAEILSGKKSTELDTNDIQTARLFAFNNAPKEILEHPAFLTVEKFYNYQNSQGHSGVNPEKIKDVNSTQDNQPSIKQVAKIENKNNTETK